MAAAPGCDQGNVTFRRCDLEQERCQGRVLWTASFTFIQVINSV